MRTFAGIDLGREPVPDESTILNFRHLMERHNLGDELFRLVNASLEENGMKVARGTNDPYICHTLSFTQALSSLLSPSMPRMRALQAAFFNSHAESVKLGKYKKP